ncbi:hypothetical protein ACWGDT_45445 [Streptomyces avermitilis]
MRNRRTIDDCVAADGATAVPTIESDSVAGLYVHLPGGRWSSVISHAWLRTFGVPDRLRVVPREGPAHGPSVGLDVARSELRCAAAADSRGLCRHNQVRFDRREPSRGS